MGIKDIFIIILGILLTFLLVLTQIESLISILFLQLIIAIMFIVSYKNKGLLLFLIMYLFVFDVFVGVNPAASALALGISGLFVYILDNSVGLFKQSPFWVGKSIWISFAGILYSMFWYNFDLQLILINSFWVIFLNLVVMNLLNLFLPNLMNASANAEISLS